MYLHSSIRPCLSYLLSEEDLRETVSLCFELSLSPAALHTTNGGILVSYTSIICLPVNLLDYLLDYFLYHILVNLNMWGHMTTLEIFQEFKGWETCTRSVC